MRSLLRACALLCSLGGLAWLALAMEVHWHQVRGGRASLAPHKARLLRVMGALALSGSLVLCLRADHASMAVLVWVMSLAVSSVGVAFALAWRPRSLSWLVGWVR